ncbi:type II secretion system pilot lipoprotein GspS [Serratia odorifera]|uniref:type II secretion system pilot lipoprotein GspS n=1 Tax=Serratia odorifera TaxID=618 RepID=UPI0018E8733F|nr:type II secretion system pilot lipoprotein GspS [Serratia odorifera]MBJ2066873.1 type II secretion system pilot lipoprotein GspS [Serratia odorifera]
MQRMLRSFSFAAAAVVLLAGCQQTALQLQTQPSLTAQLDQLSALLAGSQFLRQHCARTDIPDDASLQRSAIGMAQQRGWNTQPAEYRQLPVRAQQRYQQLQQDGTPLQQKCAALNTSTARFIAAAQSDARQ